MRKIFYLFMTVTVLGSFWLGTPTRSSASSVQIPAQQTEDFTPFSALGFTDELLLGPFSDFQVRFGVPSSWNLTSGGRVVLDLEVSSTYINQQDANVITENDFTGATIEVSFNGASLGVFILRQGRQILELDIPDAALISTRLDGRHELVLFLDAGIDCVYPHETSVLLRATSGFELPHSVNTPLLDLSKLPRPIYQQDSVQPEPLVIVIPDQPTPQELQAGLIVSAGFGRLSSGNQILAMQPQSEITDEQKEGAHLVFVGKPGGFSDLASINFPAAISGSSITLNGLGASDGVVQMAVSRWNPALSVIYIGGQDDAGVVKSAQAFSSGQLRAGLRPDLTVITSVTSGIEIPTVDTDRTLEDLGYESLEASGVGFQTLEYNFYIPFGQIAGQDSFFEMVFTHSALLDFLGSGVLIQVNDQTVGSLRLTEATANQTNSIRIPMPAYVFRPGFNTLSIQMEFIPVDQCSEFNRDGLWLNVHKTSLLHVPLIPAPVHTLTQGRDLSQYPGLFTLDPSLSNLAFVVSANDPQSWNVATELVAYLGKDATGSVLNPAVAFGDSVSDELRQVRDLIIIGRASQLPIIAELGSALPAPFTAESDLANESGMQISYLIPEGTNVGYLQLISAPWDANRTILAVLGSTSVGLDWSGRAIVTPDQIRRLRGTFAVVTDTQILTADTRLGLGTQNLSVTAIPGDYPSMITQTADSSAQPGYRRDFLLVAIGTVSALTVLFLIIFTVILRRQRR